MGDGCYSGDLSPPKLAGLVVQAAGGMAQWKSLKKLAWGVMWRFQLRRSVPSLSPTCCPPIVQSRTPAPRSIGLHWHVPALLSGAG